MNRDPLIIYIPGLLPKPEPVAHREQLLRCLLEGIRRLDADVAADVELHERSFDIVSWTYDFYGEHRDIALDMADIERLLQQPRASERDIAEAVSWKRRIAVAIYKTGDLFPFLIPKLANEKLEVHLRDLWRYTRNNNDIAQNVRRLLKVPVEAAAAARRPILLIAHSMGSVISFDALWQMSRREDRDISIDLWLTMGSPLGQKYIQNHLLGREESGARRFPDNVRRWANVSAFGDMTSLERSFGNDFGGMLSLGLVDEITDYEVFNFFRSGGALNVHAEYGYLINEATARLVRDWWCAQRG